jgi:catechol 2,3-dioxygenase-like lactoylglutathione lyase family enzyme
VKTTAFGSEPLLVRRGKVVQGLHAIACIGGSMHKSQRFWPQVGEWADRRTEIPLGEHRWLTVVSPDDPDGIELVLEPDARPAAQVFKEALVSDGIPYTSFAVDDVAAEFARLERLGVRFTQQPAEMGPVITAVFDDTCGNLIQIAQRK